MSMLISVVEVGLSVRVEKKKIKSRSLICLQSILYIEPEGIFVIQLSIIWAMSFQGFSEKEDYNFAIAPHSHTHQNHFPEGTIH